MDFKLRSLRNLRSSGLQNLNLKYQYSRCRARFFRDSNSAPGCTYLSRIYNNPSSNPARTNKCYAIMERRRSRLLNDAAAFRGRVIASASFRVIRTTMASTVRIDPSSKRPAIPSNKVGPGGSFGFGFVLQLQSWPLA